MSRARNLAGFATAVYPVDNISVGFITCRDINITGVATFQNINVRAVEYAEVAGIATVAEGLTGSPDISVGNLITSGITTIQDHLEVNDSTGAGTEYNLNVKTNGSSTFGVLGNGNILLGNSAAAPFLATNDHHAVSKKYLDDAFVDGRNISVGVATFSGDVSIDGTITYEDVTSVDSVGVITARQGINVVTGGITVQAGDVNVSGTGTLIAGVGIRTEGSVATAAGAKSIDFRGSGVTTAIFDTSSGISTVYIEGGSGGGGGGAAAGFVFSYIMGV